MVNGATILAVALAIICLILSSKSHADVGGMMLDYHFDHDRMDRMCDRHWRDRDPMEDWPTQEDVDRYYRERGEDRDSDRGREGTYTPPECGR